MKKNKNGLAEFDWTPFEDGWNGKSLRVNRSIKTNNSKIKVYSHESYAAELYAKYTGAADTEKEHFKDMIVGTSLEISAVHPIGKTTVMADTYGGGSCVIDFSKEREYIKQFGCNSPEEFVENLKLPEQQEAYLQTTPIIKVVSKDHVSLWEGFLMKIESDLHKSLSDQKTAYYAKIVGTNKGGFICSINGYTCFLPGSAASSGVVTDFDSMIGKVLPVMPINYIKGMGFVVSYKKYLSKILPNKINEELSYNMEVQCRVTGTSKNGIFVAFNDKDGEPIFTGLIYRDYMSDKLEEAFDKKEVHVDDILPARILRIDEVEGELRINLSDMDVDSKDFKNKQNRLRKQREDAKAAQKAEQSAKAETIKPEV